MAEVDRVLKEIGADKVPIIVVYNKIDMTGRSAAVERDSRDNIVAVSVSAQSGLGLELLRGAIVEFVEQSVDGSARCDATSGDSAGSLVDASRPAAEDVPSWPNAAA